MIIVLKPGASEEEISHIREKIESLGLKTHLSIGEQRTIIGVIGDERILMSHPIDAISAVEKVMPVLSPYKLVSREFHPDDSVIDVNGVKIGGDNLVIMAGPCTVENERQTIETAKAVKKAGANILRGGAFKPRTSPYSFQGLGKKGLEILAKAREITGLPVITELMDMRNIDLVCKYTDIIQIGARNVQNFDLLKEVGKVNKPVLLKRGMMTTIKEWLMSAEYIMSEGNYNVILCERGIRTFETATRNTLDLAGVVVPLEKSHLPVIVDPSHAAGNRNYVIPFAKASIAAGAHGLLIEVHINPEEALVDGAQSLTPQMFEDLMKDLKMLADVNNKRMQ